MSFKEQLEVIKRDWDNDINRKFPNEQIESHANKFEKQKIQKLIIDIKTDSLLNELEKTELINKAILFLAASSGCAEDLEISEEIFDELKKVNIINQSQIDLFYPGSSTNRWL